MTMSGKGQAHQPHCQSQMIHIKEKRKKGKRGMLQGLMSVGESVQNGGVLSSRNKNKKYVER